MVRLLTDKAYNYVALSQQTVGVPIKFIRRLGFVRCVRDQVADVGSFESARRVSPRRLQLSRCKFCSWERQRPVESGNAFIAGEESGLSIVFRFELQFQYQQLQIEGKRHASITLTITEPERDLASRNSRTQVRLRVHRIVIVDQAKLEFR